MAPMNSGSFPLAFTRFGRSAHQVAKQLSPITKRNDRNDVSDALQLAAWVNQGGLYGQEYLVAVKPKGCGLRDAHAPSR
jgi:hypothetical protein